MSEDNVCQLCGGEGAKVTTDHLGLRKVLYCVRCSGSGLEPLDNDQNSGDSGE